MSQNIEEENSKEKYEESLSIEVTNRCNSACSHCFVRAAISERSDLPIDIVKEIISEGYHLGYRCLHITGGEPLLWEGLPEMLDYAFDLGFETIFLNTNGMLLERDVSCRLAAYDGLSVSVSLDGPQALHDRVRGEGSYKLTAKNIEKALDVGLNLFIFTTVRKSLLKGLPHFADETYRRFPGIEYLTLIQLIRVKDDTFDLSKELLDPDDFLKFVWTVSFLNVYGHQTLVLSNPLACVASKMLKMPWIPHSHPLYREGSIIVMANRDITLSHSSRDSFGKFETGMLGKVLDSDEYRDATAPDKATCSTCKYHSVCMENSMLRPSEWFRDMHAEVPYCKRVLDRAAP